MNDLTKIFKLGIESQNEYNPNNIIKLINKSTNCLCDDADESNWILVWENIGKTSIMYAYVSQFYPAALVKDNCPKQVKEVFKDNNIYTAKFKEPFSCDENVLKKYAQDKTILDDRFLDDCNFSLDDTRLDYIYDGIKYVTPYNFYFEEIR